MKEEKKDFNLNMHVHRLLQSEPFFAALSRRIDKRESKAIPTAGVCVNPDTQAFEMIYNQEFFNGMTDAQRTDVLKHEFYHLVFQHVTARKPDGVNPKVWNFATDLAINSHLSNLPDGCLMPGQGPFVDYPVGLSAEAYLELLKKDENFTGKGRGEEGDEESEGDSGGGQFDDHDGWGEADDTSKEIAKERLREAIKKAATEASAGNNWGSVSGDCRKIIMDKITTKIDWRKVLRYFVKTSQRANQKSTMKRINRRYPYIHPGRKADRTAKVAISIDQSGSVDDEMLAAFFSELNKLAELAEFTVIPFDTRVAEKKVYTWKKNESKKWERVLCGGTCFDAPTKYVNERNFDGHIVLTDMMAPKPIRSNCQRMWMTTDYYANNPYFRTHERVIAITSK
jgi:predicted metal-dependent peptidase